MAITIDDLPATPDRHTFEQQKRITERLLQVLKEHDVPALGLVNEKKLLQDGQVDPRRLALLEEWLDDGHELGNHGCGHLDLHTVDPERWMADVLQGERVLRPLVEERGGELRYFRHPFLQTGRSVEVQRRTEEFLREHDYRIAPVTIDSGEWIYGDAYADAWNRGDEGAMERLGEDYVRYMLEVVEFYEGQSQRIVGEAIPHSLLIHAYALNADWLDPLLDALEARGYEWVPLEEALEHPVYDRPTHGYTGPGGITWLHRSAITEGVDRSAFRGEPEVPSWVEDLRRSRSASPGNGGVGRGEPFPVRSSSEAAPLVVERAEVRGLTSRINGVEYELRISVPHGYDDPGKRFPVVVTLDADYSFLIARNITDHLSERNHLEEVIVVGVAYGGPLRYRLNRTRDYTPTYVPDGGYGPEYQAVSGGGPEFLEAIEQEILPFVDRHYRTLPRDRTLVGHSFGGLFAAWTMLTHPDIFDNYVIVSPSIWYDDEMLLRLEEELAKDRRALPARAYLCAGSREDHRMPRDLRRLAEHLRERAYEGLRFESRILEGETHNSIFPSCLSNGLRYVLEGV
jgi:predicted alpha/beta superfamily hydrolase/peptidoglycan/xylan/chitin deacetylase (PgdA/CDA1 family)